METGGTVEKSWENDGGTSERVSKTQSKPHKNKQEILNPQKHKNQVKAKGTDPNNIVF